MSGPLEGVRVFDLTVIGVGPMATAIMALMGANVVTIEQGPMWPPAYQGSPPTTRGLTAVYMICHLAKRGIFLNLKDPKDLEKARRLVKDADLFVENMSYGTVQRLGLGHGDVARDNPRIIYGNFPGWGRTGPYSDRGSADPTAQVFSGAVATTGERGGEPEIIRWFAEYDWNASSHIVLVLLMGLLYRERTGKGMSAISPQVGAAVNVQASRIAEFLATGEPLPRMGSAATATVPDRAYRCRDNRWLAVSVVSDDQWRRLCKAVGAADLLENSVLATNSGRVANREAVDSVLEAIFASGPSKWWEIQLRKAKVPVSRFLDYSDIPDHPQIRANRIFERLAYPRPDGTAKAVDYPVIGKFPKLPLLPFANLPFQFSKTPLRLTSGMLPGAHTDFILEHGWGDESKDAVYRGPTGPIETGVLNGVTVVDMSQGIAGPFAALMLAEAGARVIKVEPPEGDYTRGWEPKVGGDGAAFFHLNRNKEGIRLDLKKPADRRKLTGLLKDADIFIEEHGQARLKRLGLDQAALEKLNPKLITCSISSFGTKGPLRDQPASELVLQAMSDFLNSLGVPGQEPVRMGPDIASCGTSVYACQAILAALYHQWRTGVGQLITVNQLATLLHQRSIQWINLVDPDDWNGFLAGYYKPPEHPYKTKDQGILLSAIRDPGKMTDLLRELGMERYIDDPLFKNPPNFLMGYGTGGAFDTGDIPHRAKPIWEKVFSRMTAEEVTAILNRYSSTSAIVNDYRQLYEHPQTKELGIFTEIDEPGLGRIRYQREPWTLDGVPVTTPTPFRELPG